MSARRRILGAAAGAVGLAAAGAAFGVRRQDRAIGRRRVDSTPFGSLHSKPLTVVAEDGVPLHVEVDELEHGAASSPLTVVFCHGYALNLDCWHFQRAAYRGLVRAVYYDQRSHGRSGRSPDGHATIDQLGRDLQTVLDHVVPDGPVVLVGHSMGGMTVVAYAEQHPEAFGDRVVGVGLISTTAGGLDPSRVLLPLLPAKLGGELANRTIRTLARRHQLVDGARRAGRSVARVATDLFAFGDEVPAAYVDFVDHMLSSTPFEVVAEFFPSFRSLDKFDAVEVMGRVPTTIICGTSDRLTSIGHSRKLHARIQGSTLLECEGAGHLVLLERHGQVNAALDQLLSAAAERVGHP
ncbi:alpha/beta hydrolase [Nocardioides anomalus]|uniref:Alpha/beta hydrolase n=1 Tax=Nocardioides anomalus TaxID=2712223 RepID=A0A6G6W9C8_9ACTN|nr:alpha/beta hydrolase [Nocardioides anomalus]QIG41809.1 alpha/beta hydrolase [Nocardioides anomalus]